MCERRDGETDGRGLDGRCQDNTYLLTTLEENDEWIRRRIERGRWEYYRAWLEYVSEFQ